MFATRVERYKQLRSLNDLPEEEISTFRLREGETAAVARNRIRSLLGSSCWRWRTFIIGNQVVVRKDGLRKMAWQGACKLHDHPTLEGFEENFVVR